jgi:hypothetical protein
LNGQTKLIISFWVLFLLSNFEQPDGNNMLYVLAPLRNLSIRKKSVGSAELALEKMTREFLTVATNVQHCQLLFDNTNRNIEEPRLEVYSARPTFKTSDDALVDLAKKLGSGGANIFVTSDRELIQRLTQCGVLICKPKDWFRTVAKALHAVSFLFFIILTIFRKVDKIWMIGLIIGSKVLKLPHVAFSY